MHIETLGILELHELIKTKKLSSEELTRFYLERSKKYAHLNAYITLREEALKDAKIIDKKIASGEEIYPLTGIPYSVKDAICTKDIRSTASARVLDNYVPPFSATVIEKIQARGGIILGKNNCDAFGHGASNENSHYGPVKNPWDDSRVPGGSSGGSAASVATGLSAYAIGEDTGGSIRQPSSFCGISGLRPSYGRNSRYGVIPMGSSLDTVGPMARSVEEIALLMEVIAGRDTKDATTLHIDVPKYTDIIKEKLPSYTVGIPKEYFAEGLEENVRRVIEEGIKQCEKLGIKTKEVSLPLTPYGIAIYYVVVPSEDSSNLARMDGIRYGVRAEAQELFKVYAKSRAQGFPNEVKRRIMIGTYALSAGYYDAYYKKAQCVRTLVVREFAKVFKEVDMLLTPTAPTVPFKIGAKSNDPLEMYLADIYMTPVSIAGLVGLNIPAGFSENLPVGMQIIAPQGKEELALQLGYHYQQATDWHKKMPSL